MMFSCTIGCVVLVPASGHFVSMKMSDHLYGNKARLQSTWYLDTIGLCLELFFWFDRDASKDQPIINVLLVSEEKLEQIIFSTHTRSNILIGWNKISVQLPEGRFQVVIEGVRSINGPSGISVDDVRIQKCSLFGMNRVDRSCLFINDMIDSNNNNNNNNNEYD